jgi:hypothetical protein
MKRALNHQKPCPPRFAPVRCDGAGDGGVARGVSGMAARQRTDLLTGTGLLTALAVCVLVATAAAQSVSIELRGSVALDAQATDQHGQAFTVTGLSAITRLYDNRYAMVMDNSNKVVYVDVDTDGEGSIISAAYAGGLSLAEARDFEGIALSETPGRILLAEEGVPGVLEFDLATGVRTRSLATPAPFTARRANFGFESLTRDAQGRLWTANEEALTVDGPVSTAAAGTFVRLLRYDPSPTGYEAGPQHAYRTQPLHGSAISGSRSGVADLVALPDGTLLVLERSFAFSAQGFFRTRIYRVDPRGLDDVSANAGFLESPVVPAPKDLLWSGDLANLEGLCLGPAIDTSRHLLLGVTDDGDPITTNRLVAFVLTLPVCAADFNGDGGVDGADVEAFFEAWENGQTSADVNADGGIDGADVEFFFEVWSAGGCE